MTRIMSTEVGLEAVGQIRAKAICRQDVVYRACDVTAAIQFDNPLDETRFGDVAKLVAKDVELFLNQLKYG